jgi:ABC-type polysaccharide/polyol phosphate transport system ATPase subunit
MSILTPKTASNNYVIEAAGISLSFRVQHDRPTTLKEAVMRKMRGAANQEDLFWALDGVSFTIAKGEWVGVIGLNGSGKTTLLSVIAGIYRPDKGSIYTQGRVVGLLGLGVGFDMEMTGRENIPLNASLYGLSRKQIEERMDDIIAFADIGDFIDSPVKNYSSGMVSRLGFAVASHLDADIILLDEILAVGDAQFKQKCLTRMKEFRNQDRTMLFVAHDLGALREFCQRAIWLEHGKLIADGPAKEIIDAFENKYTPGTHTVAQI